MTASLCALVAASAAFFGTAALGGAQDPPCYERNLGTDLNLGDDSVAPDLQLGFAFPYAGGTVTQITVSSNGFVWMAPSSNNRCCQGQASRFLADPPSVAPLWTDLTPTATGAGVYFNALPNRAVVTWHRVQEFGTGTQFTVQLQLLSTGAMIFDWDSDVAVTRHETIVGVTPGRGVSDPGEIDYSSSLPHDSRNEPTVYEEFSRTADPFDLAGRNIVFLPDGRGNGYIVFEQRRCRSASVETYGTGCPLPPVVYETFARGSLDLSNTSFEFVPNGFGGWQVRNCSTSCWESNLQNNLSMTDDSVVQNLQLGFRFTHPGGSTTAVDVASNGCLYLLPNTIPGSRCCNGIVARFLAETPSVAVLWQDLNPTAGGAVYFDTYPGRAVLTYDRVPEFATANPNTCQAQLFADGRMILSYGSVSATRHDVLVGVSAGSTSVDPGPVDFTTRPPFDSGPGGVPLALDAAPGGRPVLGGTFTVELTRMPGSATAGIMAYGLTRLSVDLARIGMPACFLLGSAEASLPIAVGAPAARVGVQIPDIGSLAGAPLYVQGILLVPGGNPAGAIASNGLAATLGR